MYIQKYDKDNSEFENNKKLKISKLMKEK